ncbi:MAG: hypothetical protein V4469_02005 [Patescibacteria group bacterium]
MNNTEYVTVAQVENVSHLIENAIKGSVEIVIDELIQKGSIDHTLLQRFLGNGDRLPEKIIPFLEKMIPGLCFIIKGCVKHIFHNDEIAIPATDGTETLADAADVFINGVDPAFGEEGKSGKVTEKTEVEVWEMVEPGSFAELFRSFDRPLDDLCFSQMQIKMFAKHHRQKLQECNRPNFFLYKVGGDYFVAIVRFGYEVDTDRIDLSVSRRRFDYNVHWSTDSNGFCFRIIVPKQNL